MCNSGAPVLCGYRPLIRLVGVGAEEDGESQRPYRADYHHFAYLAGEGGVGGN